MPKPRPRGVGDGKQVNIPVPPCERLSEGGTQEGKSSRRRSSWFKPVGGEDRQIRLPISNIER